jgi:hypothetical protein
VTLFRRKELIQVSVRLSFDRLEGNTGQVAVLLTDDGEPVNLPRTFLPSGAQPGDVLVLSLKRDDGASSELAERSREVENKISKRDPGGDIRL